MYADTKVSNTSSGKRTACPVAVAILLSEVVEDYIILALEVSFAKVTIFIVMENNGVVRNAGFLGKFAIVIVFYHFALFVKNGFTGVQTTCQV